MTSPPTGHGASAHEAFRAGRLQEAVQALGDELRGSPGDAQRRTFLFELLCFAGQYDRAERQLDVLGAVSKEAGLGAMPRQCQASAPLLSNSASTVGQAVRPGGEPNLAAGVHRASTELDYENRQSA
jgi:hypothetical protein